MGCLSVHTYTCVHTRAHIRARKIARYVIRWPVKSSGRNTGLDLISIRHNGLADPHFGSAACAAKRNATCTTANCGRNRAGWSGRGIPRNPRYRDSLAFPEARQAVLVNSRTRAGLVKLGLSRQISCHDDGRAYSAAMLLLGERRKYRKRRHVR